jgi:protein-L-isoaspartate(D-aspartate) O-methyltransferase
MTLRGLFPALAIALACDGGTADDSQQRPVQDQFARQRERMVAEQLAGRDIRDPRVLSAMRKVPRHQFVPAPMRDRAYQDSPLPIGNDQTISQPYIVAYMTQALELKPSHKVLEIGTGSGYQAAVLGELAAEVYTIEIVGELATRATKALADAGYRNIHVRHGDGYAGWPEHAPFDAIMVTAAAPRVPEPLKQQLKDGGRLILPVGDHTQELRIVTRHGAMFKEENILPVRFVPMIGEIRKD